jgi:glycosyltransferase involved in cell wall biosynthesis
VPLRLSIALCTYNGAKFLREQLDSFVMQTRRPDELIICDDWSSDDTVKLAETFAASAPFPVSVHVNASNLGIGGNFEGAMRRCTGDIIFLADQDDVWLPSKLARFEAEFERDASVGMAFCDADVMATDGRKLGYTHWDVCHVDSRKRDMLRRGRAFDAFLRHPWAASATMAIRRNLLDAVLPLSPHWMHDAWIGLVAGSVSKVVAIEEPLNLYRQHAGQAMGGRAKSRWERYRENLGDKTGEYQREVSRFTELRDRVSGKAPPQRLRMIEQKLALMRARLRMRRSRLARYPLIVGQLLRGRYHAYANGFRTVATDLLT